MPQGVRRIGDAAAAWIFLALPVVQAAMSSDSGSNALAARSAGGDPEALAKLIRRFTPVVHGFFRRRLSEGDAESLTQDVWLRVARAILVFDPDRGRFAAWLLTIARNVLLDELQKRDRRPRLVSGERHALENLPSPEQVDLHSLAACLDKLTEEDREMIHLRHWEGLSLQEIAEKLQVTYGAVKAKANRAEKKLLACLRR